MKARYWIPLLSLCIPISSCTYVSEGVVAAGDRYAEALPKDHFGDSADKIVYLEQNWDRWDSLWFYNTTQGSDFMPYDLFVNLEQTDNEKPFHDVENMSRFRYLGQRESWDNPDGLPVGFVKDSYQGHDYVGFTCAACHTGQINYRGTGIRIDGGPSLADMDGLLRALEKALTATLDDEAKLNRLASNMSLDPATARSTAQASRDWLRGYNRTNLPTNTGKVVNYGYGRLDAFGRIYNRVLGHLTPGNSANANPPNAPVSYPFLWDTPQHDYVQWDGVADNNSGPPVGFLGPLGRNTGEVLGVFATFSLEDQKNHLGYKASVDKRNLVRLEKHLTSLESPQWPQDILPKIDQKLADEGKEVFYAYKCFLCHGDDGTFRRDDKHRKVIAQFASVNIIGTDPQMASNALDYQGESGLFKGKKINLAGKDRFGETTHVVFALQNAAQGVIVARDPDKSWLRARAEWLYDVVTALFDNPVKQPTQRHVDFEINTDFPNNLNAYKARPLNGIWATAPYLHNGSVPNLYELFLPSCNDQEIAAGKECRANHFTVGSREFDPVKVGLMNKDKGEYPGLFEFDTSLPANHNAGHEYSAGRTAVIKVDADGKAIRKPDGGFEMEWLPPITDTQRWALVEYLKTY
ncbi:MAG: hypothetical protein GC138_06540 [Gammaproteobacteria bacterium]|nr:hypothetical protein [Gammaproteobacteria bacterium]